MKDSPYVKELVASRAVWLQLSKTRRTRLGRRRALGAANRLGIQITKQRARDRRALRRAKAWQKWSRRARPVAKVTARTSRWGYRKARRGVYALDQMWSMSTSVRPRVLAVLQADREQVLTVARTAHGRGREVAQGLRARVEAQKALARYEKAQRDLYKREQQEARQAEQAAETARMDRLMSTPPTAPGGGYGYPKAQPVRRTSGGGFGGCKCGEKRKPNGRFDGCLPCR